MPTPNDNPEIIERGGPPDRRPRPARLPAARSHPHAARQRVRLLRRPQPLDAEGGLKILDHPRHRRDFPLAHAGVAKWQTQGT